MLSGEPEKNRPALAEEFPTIFPCETNERRHDYVWLVGVVVLGVTYLGIPAWNHGALFRRASSSKLHHRLSERMGSVGKYSVPADDGEL